LNTLLKIQLSRKISRGSAEKNTGSRNMSQIFMSQLKFKKKQELSYRKQIARQLHKH